VGWKRPLFAVATLALFLALVELLLAARGVRPLLDERDPFAGFSERVRVFELDAASGRYRTAPRALVHSFHRQEFAARKPPGGYRIFVLGGSSAFGFPWGAEVAFPHALGAALQASTPGRLVETVNAAAMSYGSHRLRILATELLDHEPDALVIYGGHNEFVERRFYRDRLERRTELDPARALLQRWRLYSLLARLLQQRTRHEVDPLAARNPGELLGLDVVRETATHVAAAETERVRADFAANLRAILAAAHGRGVRVVLCSVPSNLRDWRPNQSIFGSDVTPERRRQVLELLTAGGRALDGGDPGAAVASLEQAVRLAPMHAEAQFRLGRAYEALGRFADARDRYVLARDVDAQPTRAPSRLNATLRALATEPGVTFVDVEKLFEEASPHGILGFSLFEDYVHPKPEAHRLIAFALWRAFLERGLMGPARPAPAEEFARLVGPGPGRGSPAAPAAASGPATVRQLYNLAFVLENQGLDQQAIDKFRAVLERQPAHHGARYNLARLLARGGNVAEAERECRTALDTARDDPLYAPILIALADTQREQGRAEEATANYRRALAIDPRNAAGWGRLGDALAESGRPDEAERAFRQALELDPADVEALAGLGFVQLLAGRTADALAGFARAAELRPDHVRARGGLAAALVEAGRLDEAERLFREVLRDAPDDAMARGGIEIIARRRAVGRGP